MQTHPPCARCADIVWKYNLKSHILTTHPGADLDSYQSYYAITAAEREGLKTISKKKSRQRSGKKINFKISERHSTDSALGCNLNSLSYVSLTQSRSLAEDKLLASDNDENSGGSNSDDSDTAPSDMGTENAMDIIQGGLDTDPAGAESGHSDEEEVRGEQ
jgi:hypothetical protein